MSGSMVFRKQPLESQNVELEKNKIEIKKMMWMDEHHSITSV